jgi:hypothetical protein
MMTPMGSPISSDPFGTAQLQNAVLGAWAASPARFREDANAEEELTRGAYRDRVVVELAQNAADAALRTNGPGRLLLRLDDGTLRAANTGAPLDPTGVESLSTLRASAKRDEPGAVGRFGVGFAAVLAVTDEPVVVSQTGGVRWSRAEAAAIAGTLPALKGELARRGTAVPVLRLPLPATGDVPAGYDTEVRLPLRDEVASRLVRELIADVDDALLLALPGLDEVILEVDGRRVVLTATRAAGEVVVTEGARRTRWKLTERSGQVPAHLLADRPVEEPDWWSVTVAVPLDDTGAPTELPASMPRAVHAPTPTDDRTDLPALVLASFPLDSSRRRVVPGALTDLLVAEVAVAYAELAAGLAVEPAAGPAVLRLAPSPLPAGEVDALLHRAVVATLARTALVPPAAAHGEAPGRAEPSGAGRLAPQDVVLVDGLAGAADPAALAPFVPGLPDPAWWQVELLRRLGARRTGLGEIVDRLSGRTLTPAAWRELYAALDGADRDALATLPVPLADGRLVRGARGVLLPTAELDADTLAPLGLRVAAPAAVHPLLARLGAQEATAGTVLRDPLVRMAVDAGDENVPDAVLRLVAAAGTTAEDEPWLAELRLPDGTGAPVPAGELYLPGSPVLALLDVDPAEYAVSEAVLAQWGRQLLLDIGVRDGFAVLRLTDAVLDADGWHDLDDEAAWIDATLAELPDQDLPPVVPELLAIRDLDLVRDDSWPAALTTLASDPRTRPALLDPAYVLLADGSRRAVRSYPAWWLRTHAQIAGRPLATLCAADSEPQVRRVLAPLPGELDLAAARALGLVRTVADLVGEPDLLLDRLADPGVELSAAELGEWYSALARPGLDPDAVEPPDRVRVPAGSDTRLVAATEVVVATGPHWLQLDLPAVVPGPVALADLLDVPLAAELHDAEPDSDGVAVPVPAAVRRLLPNVADGYVEHDELIVAGRPVDWWVDEQGAVHAATADGLARGLAWTSGHWAARFEVAEALRDPDVVPSLLAERTFAPLSRVTTLPHDHEWFVRP